MVFALAGPAFSYGPMKGLLADMGYLASQVSSQRTGTEMKPSHLFHRSIDFNPMHDRVIRLSVHQHYNL